MWKVVKRGKECQVWKRVGEVEGKQRENRVQIKNYIQKQTNRGEVRRESLAGGSKCPRDGRY